MKNALNSIFLNVILRTALSGVLLTGCSHQDQDSKSLLNYIPGYDAIFSNRAQTATDSIVMIKLQNPPLLAALKATKDGKKQTDPDLIQAIKFEQDAMVAQLMSVDPQITVIYRYRMVINGMAIDVPLASLAKVQKLTNVVYVETSTSFSRPALAVVPESSLTTNPFTHTSVKFIGGDEAHAQGLTGKGVKVGVIDTGIDYTHAMFGGVGTVEAYNGVNPNVANPAFPSAKVVGGIDLVGSAYDSAAGDYTRHIPHIDANPIDEAGHGSHVAGTIAGHGDGVNTYDGVAPDAVLYAIKVFGKEGSTGDEAVIAGLDYAADPNGDGDVSDQLDVVNLSLGSDYGDPHILYTEAVQNLSRAGTVVVISAGNAGDNSYVVGAPGVADEALSVAASIDDADQNWKFNDVVFTTPDGTVPTEAIESGFSTPIAAADVTAVLVFVGAADKDLTPDVAAKLVGKVAFIDRGIVSFEDKAKRVAAAGAIGLVVANNQPGDPIVMGGDAGFKVPFPAIMISLDLANKLKAEQAKGDVSIAFKTNQKTEKPELIDTIAMFSSKGPRSIDALIKPEIAAPGQKVISAARGQGDKGIQMSGTSMAAPHMTGVMALMKQKFPKLSPAELKSVVMGTTKTLVDANKKVYPISRQGAGRVQIMAALNAKIVSSPSALSLGEVTIESRKMLRRQITFKNITTDALTLNVQFSADSGLSLQSDSTLTLAAGAQQTLPLTFNLDARGLLAQSAELDGLLKLTIGGNEVLRVPILAVINKVSQVGAQQLLVHSSSVADSQGAAADLTMVNPGANAGGAYIFNLIGNEGRKQNTFQDPFLQTNCDLQSAGYRVIQKKGEPYVQFAIKLYEPLTTWDNCEISILVDSDKDGVADQELVGIKADSDHLKGLTAAPTAVGNVFASFLLDAPKARTIRKKFELDSDAAKPGDKVKEDYTDAILFSSSMLAPENSTVAIVEVPVGALKLRSTGELAVKIATSSEDSSALEPDDFLNKSPEGADGSDETVTATKGPWLSISVGAQGPAYIGMPEMLTVAAGATVPVPLTKGAGAESLWILYPTNAPVIGGINLDWQSQTVAPKFDLAQ